MKTPVPHGTGVFGYRVGGNAFSRSRSCRFRSGPPGVAGEPPPRADYPVAGDEKGDRIVTDGISDGSGGRTLTSALFGQSPCDAAVGYSVSIRNAQQKCPHCPSERGACGRKRRRGTGIRSPEIYIEPFNGSAEYRERTLRVFRGKRFRVVFLPFKPETGQCGSVGGKSNSSQGRSIVTDEIHECTAPFRGRIRDLRARHRPATGTYMIPRLWPGSGPFPPGS